MLSSFSVRGLSTSGASQRSKAGGKLPSGLPSVGAACELSGKAAIEHSPPTEWRRLVIGPGDQVPVRTSPCDLRFQEEKVLQFLAAPLQHLLEWCGSMTGGREGRRLLSRVVV